MGSPGRSPSASGTSQLTPGKLQRHNRANPPPASSTGMGGLGLGSTRGSPGGGGAVSRLGMNSSRRSDAGYSTASTKSGET